MAQPSPLRSGKQTEKKERHLKYMHPSQQTSEHSQKQGQTLVERKHYGQDLHRLSALDFAKEMREYGLFENLTGQACPNQQCSSSQKSGFGAGGGSVLGGLSASSNGKIPGSDITLKDCSYRCMNCRQRFSVTHNNIYFPLLREEAMVQRDLSILVF